MATAVLRIYARNERLIEPAKMPPGLEIKAIKVRWVDRDLPECLTEDTYNQWASWYLFQERHCSKYGKVKVELGPQMEYVRDNPWVWTLGREKRRQLGRRIPACSEAKIGNPFARNFGMW
ncbi:MAG: hypothetical protein Q9170_007853 [Blastenia crenularia]